MEIDFYLKKQCYLKKQFQNLCEEEIDFKTLAAKSKKWREEETDFKTLVEEMHDQNRYPKCELNQ